MSERWKATRNPNASKNTRLPIASQFGDYRFGRDALAHVSRYLWICEYIIALARGLGRPVEILDIGCGDIYIARVLIASFRVRKADVVARYVGLDIDDKSLRRTGKSRPASLPITLIQGDITDGALAQFKDQEFDLIICTEVIEHLQPRFVEGLLREINRLAKRALISTPNFSGGSGRLPEDHIKEWGVGELTALIRKCNLRVRGRIGVFCNLNRVAKLGKTDKKLAAIYSYLKPRMDAHFLSICMARFLGVEAQNILYICEGSGFSIKADDISANPRVAT